MNHQFRQTAEKHAPEKLMLINGRLLQLPSRVPARARGSIAAKAAARRVTVRA